MQQNPQEEKKRRRWTWKRRSLSDVLQLGLPADLPAGTAHSVEATAQSNARSAYSTWVGTSGGPGEAWLNDWSANLQSRVKAHARANCQDLGYPVTRSVTTGNGQWYYSDDQDSGANFQFKASREFPYTANCYKRVRR